MARIIRRRDGSVVIRCNYSNGSPFKTEKVVKAKIKKRQIRRGKYKKNLAELDVNGTKYALLIDVDLKAAKLKQIKKAAKAKQRK